MNRKFKFLGYGDREPFDGDYGDIDLDKQYFFTDIALTVGKVYEAISITKGYTVPDDARFIDDDGSLITQELRFFEEVFDDFVEPSPEELAQMDANAEELLADFIGE